MSLFPILLLTAELQDIVVGLARIKSLFYLVVKDLDYPICTNFYVIFDSMILKNIF